MIDIGRLDYYILGEVVTCFLSLILIINILVTYSKTEIKYRMYLYGGISSFFTCFFDVAASITLAYYHELPLWINYFTNFFYFVFMMLITLVLCDFGVFMAVQNKKTKKTLLSINGFIYLFFFLVLLINFKTGWIFSFNYETGYVRGILKHLTYGITLFYLIECIVAVAVNRNNMPDRVFIVFVFYPIVAAMIIAVQFIFQKVLLTGTAAFSALMVAYIAIQTDKLEFDSSTGLMTGHVLENHLRRTKKPGVLFLVLIDNLNQFEGSVTEIEFKQFILDFSKIFLKNYKHNSYIINSNRFVALCSTNEQAERLYKTVKEFLVEFSREKGTDSPVLDAYYIAVEFIPGEKVYTNIIDIVNSLLYKVKVDQNHNLQLCDDTILINLERKNKIYNILKKELTLESEQFQVWYQPIYSLAEQKFVYMEALSRLQNTPLGDIPPQEFVEVAESKGLIERLGMVAFEKVCKYIADNRDTVHAVSINFSVYQMTNPNIVSNVLNTIAKFGLNPSNIIMEITESIFIDNYETVLKNMTDLSNAGVKFYLDDFGTGYSNLSNVVRLPFTTIKIDRSLVLMMEESDENTRFFFNLVSTFKDAGLKILVEGVETQNQNYLVQKAGVDYIQGFLYSRPLVPEKCIEVLKRSK